MGEMNFAFRDIYPTFSGEETSTAVIPDAEDMSALNENDSDADKAGKNASGKKLIFGAIALIAVVVILGGA